jgi:hypothetical protein
MGILDEAIREHLELKRQHGAEDSELKQLEDDAFGPPQRPGAAEDAPDPASEAATEFMAQPDLGGVSDDEGAQAEQPEERPPVRREPIAEVQEAPERAEEDEQDDGPAEEQQPAAEHETVQPPPASHSTEERHAIADQPTEMFDVEKEFASGDAAAPSDEELVAEEIAEPRLAPAEPLDALAPEEPEGEVEVRATADDDEEDDDDFFDEQRLSEELDQALEAPLEPDSEEVPRPAAAPVESESEEMEREGRDEDEHDEGEHDEDEADSEESARPAARKPDEDVLEETPDFLEEAPEDDQLWFEQKPPKDFDFDD